jgi:putative MATE family efflux protein
MRAVGDTLRPLLFLIIGGVLNIGLNIFFIVVLHRDVEGVAIATVASQAVSAILSLIVLIKGEGYAKLEKKHFRFYKDEFKDIVAIGLPTGLSRCMFSLSNVVLVSTLNGFGEQVIAANTIAHQYDAIVHDATDAFAMGTLSFVSQNLGAKNFKRVWITVIESLFLVTGVGLALGILMVLFSNQLCGIMTSTPEVIAYGSTRMMLLGPFFFTTGIMNVFSNVLKWLGKATLAMIGSLVCTVVFRLVWIYLIFPLNPTLEVFYIAYPISWGLCAVVFAVLAIPILLKKQKEFEREKEDNKQISDNQLESTN